MEDFMPTKCMREEDIKEHSQIDIRTEIEYAYHMASIKSEVRNASGFYSPSYISGCSRALYYGRTKAEMKQSPSIAMSINYELGDAIHEVIQNKLKTIPSLELECEYDIEFAPLKIRGRVDGVSKKLSWVFEIKTTSDTQFKTLVKPKLPHVWQVHCYMWCLDIPRSQILYVNKSNGDMRTFRVKFQEKVWEEIVGKISFIEKCIKSETPPPREVSKWTCGECRFFHICNPLATEETDAAE